MHEKIRQLISDCAASSVGRLFFVAHLVYAASMISFFYDHISIAPYPFRFYGEKELFELINWPQMELIRSSRFLVRWQSSRLTDLIFAFYISMPWWVYGFVFERIVKRIASIDGALGVGEFAIRDTHSLNPSSLEPADVHRPSMEDLRR